MKDYQIIGYMKKNKELDPHIFEIGMVVSGFVLVGLSLLHLLVQ